VRRLLRLRGLLRAGLLFAGALCGATQAAEAARVEVTAQAAWQGWSRPGRASEVDVRLSSNVATRATLELVSGRQTVHTELDLQPGRVQRLQLPVSATAGLVLRVSSAAAPTVQQGVVVAPSESPLLAVGLASDERVQLEGFHGVAVTADDLPRHGSAYGSIDALIVDAATLRALDPPQLAALLAHAAACGRIAVVGGDDRLRTLLAGAGGCGGRALSSAPTLATAQAQLAESLAVSLPTAMAPGSAGALGRPDHALWNQVAVMLAVYFAAALLALLFIRAWQALLIVPAVAAALALALLHGLQAPPQLLIWSEGESGAALARYQAWQTFSGAVRERVRAPVPPQLSASVQACDAKQALRLGLDASSGRAVAAEFDTQLFRQVLLCFEGGFPMSRALAVAAQAGDAREVRNAGTTAWPAGLLLADGQLHDLPPLAPGAGTTLAASAARPPQGALQRTALARTPPGHAAALWALELGGVAQLPLQSQAWLLVAAPAP
jgi:hypothetical protein